MSEFEQKSGLIGEVNPWVVSSFFFYASLLTAKLLLNAPLTGFARGRSKIFPNPEDQRRYQADDAKGVRKQDSDAFLNRILRIHSNDLENIIPFLMIGFLYAMSYSGSFSTARWHFRVFFGARIITSICHLFALQPVRTLFFMVAMAVNVSMVAQIIMKAGINYI